MYKTKSKIDNAPRISDYVKDYVRYTLHQPEIAKELSAAHNFGHLDRVATGAYQIVIALGGTEREAETARAGGYLHDLVRSRTELMDDEQASAEKAKPMLSQLVKSGVFTREEMDIILASIKTKTVNKAGDPSDILSSKEKDNKEEFLKDRSRLIRFAVWAADKIEANGAFVMARRSQFVGGERFFAGDIGKLKQRLQNEGNPLAKEFDSELAILSESILRLGIINNPNLYPQWFRPVVDKLFDQQLEFYYPLLADKKSLLIEQGSSEDLEEDLEKMLIDIKFPAVKAADIQNYEKKRDKAGSKARIAAVTPGQIEAAKVIVKYFSAQESINTDTTGLIRRFKPEALTQNEDALMWLNKWHGEMLSYLNEGMGPLLQVLVQP